MAAHIQVKLFASLQHHLPPDPDAFPITPGETIEQVLTRLGVSPEAAKLVFVDGVLRGVSTALQGGERVGVFPPVGGG